MTTLGPFHGSLTGMPNDHYRQLVPFLAQKELAALACVDRSSQRKVNGIRAQMQHLDISATSSRTKPLEAIDLIQALRLHPNFSSVDLSNHKGMLVEVSDLLAGALKTRAITSFNAGNTDLSPPDMQLSGWKTLLSSIPPSLQHFARQLQDGGSTTIYQLILQLASRCDGLKTILLPDKSKDASLSGPTLLRALPQSLEFLGPHWSSVSDEMADLMITKFNPEILQGCSLTFQNDSSNTEKKRLQLVQFLPFLTMHHVELKAKNGSEESGPVISMEMLEQIASKLQANTKLNVLNLTGIASGENLTKTIVQLIHSIQSVELEELTLLPQLDTLSDMTLIFEAITAKLPTWPRIRSIQVGSLSLANFLPATQDTTSSMIKAFTVLGSSFNHFAEARKTCNLTGSIPSILAYYSTLHNELDPANPLTPSQIIQEYKSFVLALSYIGNTNWKTPTELIIRVLEPLFQKINTKIQIEKMLKSKFTFPSKPASSPSTIQQRLQEAKAKVADLHRLIAEEQAASLASPVAAASPAIEERRELLHSQTQTQLIKDAS